MRYGIRGLLLAAFSVCLLFAHGNRLAHDFLVRHVVCEHGAVTHEEAPGATRRAGEVAEAFARGHRGPEASADGAAHGGTDHEHCDARSLLHRIGEVGTAIPAASLLQIDPPAQDGSAFAFAPIALLDLAPKGSPPRG